MIHESTSLLTEENEERSDEVNESDSTVINEDNSEIELYEVEQSTWHSRSKTPETSAENKRKEKEENKGKLMEAVLGKVMKTVTESLNKSDKLFVELEEKSMNFEKLQKREERQFHLQMMQMLLGSSHRPHTHADHLAHFIPGSPLYADLYFNPHEGTDS